MDEQNIQSSSRKEEENQNRIVTETKALFTAIHEKIFAQGSAITEVVASKVGEILPSDQGVDSLPIQPSNTKKEESEVITETKALFATIQEKVVAQGTVISEVVGSKVDEVLPLSQGVAVAASAASHVGNILTWGELPSHMQAIFTRVGTHGGYRNLAEAQLAFQTDIPDSVKSLGLDGLLEWLSNKDYSHKISHANGGSNHPDNLIFEDSSINRARGAENMTIWEETQAHIDNFTDIFFTQEFGEQLTKSGVEGAKIGAVYAFIMKTVSQGLAYQRGEITIDEFTYEVLKAIIVGSLSGAALGIAIMVVCTIFPPLGAVLSFCVPILTGGAYVGLASQIAAEISHHIQLTSQIELKEKPTNKDSEYAIVESLDQTLKQAVLTKLEEDQQERYELQSKGSAELKASF